MDHLILILCEELEFAYHSTCPDEFRDRAGNRYQKCSQDEDNGFYDWLRSVNGEIIGVRWYPYYGALIGKQVRYLKELKNIILDDDLLCITIYFDDQRIIDEPHSCDQDFLGNYLYFSKAGKCAISFTIETLTEKERLSLPIR